MFQTLRKLVIKPVDWFLYTALSTKTRDKIKNLFSEEQRRFIRTILKNGKRDTYRKHIGRLKFHLYNLGFTKKALADLEEIFQTHEDAYMRQITAWELALYYANQYTPEAAEKCLYYLPHATEGSKDVSFLRQAAILEAESYDILNRQEEGKRVIEQQLQIKPHPDLYLAAASLEPTPEERLNWINKALEVFQIPAISLAEDTEKTAYDRFQVQESLLSEKIEEKDHKVTIIIPAYNSGDSIQTSLDSLMAQTWRNIEIIVVDDCSTDNTKEVVEKYRKKDPRIKLMQNKENSGAYVARNNALEVATGEFVTINDADDWSHPDKIRVQVQHLISHQKYIGNFSQQARITEDLKFFRRGKPGQYIFSNMSSFMFRREPVMEKLGFWDSVRFAGDRELIERIKRTFGHNSVVNLSTALYSFQRQSEGSLTGNSAFGYPGYFMGARKEYKEVHENFHQHNENLKYKFPQTPRPYPIPEPMWPKREEKQDGYRIFDTIIATDFRATGDLHQSNLKEIKKQLAKGGRIALVQLNEYNVDLGEKDEINQEIRDMVDGEKLQFVVYGEKLQCNDLIILNPATLAQWQQYVPTIEAKQVSVVVNQLPKEVELIHCAEQMNDYFGTVGTWYPTTDSIRQQLQEQHQDELNWIQLSTTNWTNETEFVLS